MPHDTAGGARMRVGGKQKNPEPGKGSGGIVDAAASDIASNRVELLLWAPVALGLGIGSYFALPVEPPLGLTIGALLLLLLAWAVPGFTSGSKGRIRKILLAGMILALAGMLLAELRSIAVAGPVIARETRPLTLTGQIIRIERKSGDHLRLLLDVEGMSGRASDELPRRVRVNVRTSAPELRPGDKVSMLAILRPPPEPILPGGYDFARSAWFQRIGALGFTISDVTRFEERPDESLEIHVEGVRDGIALRVSEVIQGDAGALAVALITGLRGGLSDEVQDNMRGAGLAHLLAISGLHMALVTGALFFGVRALLALSPTLALKYPIKKIAALAAWAGAVFYLMLSGSGISTQRAFIMVSIVLLAVLLDRQAISLRLVALAAMLVLLFSPESLLSASFQMSFAAVAALVSGFEWQQQRFGGIMAGRRGLLPRAAWYLWGTILATLIAEASIGPVAAFHFHRVALFGIPANVIAMPLMSFWIMPLAVLALVLMPLGLEAIALVPMGWGLEVLLVVAGEVAGLPGAVRSIPAMPFASFLLIIAGGLWLVLTREARWRRMAALPLLLALPVMFLAERPDVLIGRQGKIFAVADGAGDYVISTRRAGRFTRRVWLETYGQEDYEIWPMKGGRVKGEGADIPVRCDAVACVYGPPAAPGEEIVFLFKRDGFGEECNTADILISRHFAPRSCNAPELVIDGRVMRREGAITLFRVDGGWRMHSVAMARGERPWSTNEWDRE